MGLKNWIAQKALQGKFPLWTYRLAGKILAKKINLREDNMADDSKKWYQSKAVWAAILTALVGAIQPVSAAFQHPIAVPLWIIEVLTGFGIYGIRTGDKTIQ